MKKVFKIVILIVIISIILVLSINFYVIHSSKKQIIKEYFIKLTKDLNTNMMYHHLIK